MARVLLVDDEAEHRKTVADVVRALGHQVVEACSGSEGVDKAAPGGFALAVIDHALPDLSGAAVVEAMRVQGNRTPVIMLMSDFKRATLAALMKLGVAEMITKPLHAAELEEKIARLVGRGAAVVPVDPPAPEAAPSPAAAPAQPPSALPSVAAARAAVTASSPGTPARTSPPSIAAARAAVTASSPGTPARTSPTAPTSPDEPADAKVLIVEHMDAACRALASLIPEGLGVHTCHNIFDAQLKMRARSYRLIFFDAELPVNGLPGLIDQFREQQKEAVFVGVEVAKEDGEPERKDSGVFDDMVARPFDATLIAEVADQFTGSFQRVVSLEGEDLLTVASFRGRRPRLDAYLEHLDKRLQHHLRGLAEACVDSVIVDVTCLPQAYTPRAARFVADLLLKQAALGLQLRLVAAAPLQEALRALPEIRDLRSYFTLQDARAAG